MKAPASNNATAITPRSLKQIHTDLCALAECAFQQGNCQLIDCKPALELHRNQEENNE